MNSPDAILTRLLAFVILSFATCHSANAAPLSGTKTVGPTGNYASITAALADVQAQTLGGALVLELQSSYVSTVETFPLTIPALNGASAVNTLTLRPASGATALAITSANTTAATVDLNGAQFVTFDGRPGGVGTAKQLTVANTSTSGVAVRFINEASGNALRYLTLQGVNPSASSGTVVFSTTTGANGNDDNTVDSCDIRDGASTPANGIYSLGTTTTTAQNNSGNTVSNCNIFNFFSTSSDVAGVRLDGGNTVWTIAGNSCYQTAARALSSGIIRPIYIGGSGSQFIVTGNAVGGSAPSAGGSPWTTSGTTGINAFEGISLAITSGSVGSVQGNTIRNIIWKSSGGDPSTAPWTGIYFNTGSLNNGTVMGNTIGSGTGTGSISVTTSNGVGTTYGIRVSTSGYGTIANNTVGSITTNSTDNNHSASLIGIQISGHTMTIANNIVGSTTTANSLNAATSSGTASFPQQVAGIVNSSEVATVMGNTVANLNNNYVGTNTSGQIRGIVSETFADNALTGNTVRNLSTTSQNTGSAALAAVLGISQSSSAAGQTASQNVVHSLASTAASVAVNVSGIYFTGSTTAGPTLIARNLVHSLSIASTSTGAKMYGMYLSSGTFTAQNNMVRVGLAASGASTAGASTVMGIADATATAGRNFYHNSIYVGGAQTSGTNSTYAFNSSGASGARDLRNNIFVNARSNSGATGKHYAVQYGGTIANPAGLTANNNLFFVSGSGGVLGFYNSADRTTLAAWQAATGQDASSMVADPRFVNPTATALTVDLHLQSSNSTEGQGIPLASVTDDFDGQTRSALTPVDIGADAGAFTWIDGSAPSLSYPLLSDTLSLANRLLPGFATITDNVGISGGVKSPRLYFKKSTDADVFNVPNNSTGNGWKYVATESIASPYDFTADYSLLNGGGVANGDTIQYFAVAQDEANNLVSTPSGAASSANPPVQNVSAKPAGVNSYRVGDFTVPTISYPLLTIGSTSNRALTDWASIGDNVGVAGGANAPRFYYRKSTDADAFGVANNSTGNGWKYVTATGSGPYSFTIDYALLNGGSIAAGDTIQYFVVAQDAANNRASSPAGVTASANPPVQNVNGHGVVNSFSIFPGIVGTVTVGSGGTYPSLSGAGGLFAALNGAVLTGDVVVKITSDLTETGGVTLGQWLEEGAGNYTVTIQPDSATMRTISGSATAGLITLNGADRVTLDGRFGGSGRYLTFRNTNTGNAASTLLFINDACGNTIRNCIVEGLGAITGSTYGVICFSTGTITGNDNNLIIGCQVRDVSTTSGVPYILIGSIGSSTAVANSGNTVSNNELFNFNSSGIYIGATGNTSWALSDNNIYEVNASTGGNIGIGMFSGGTNVISGNNIHDLLADGAQSVGIFFQGTGTTTLAHNRITALDVNAATTSVYGIVAQGLAGSTLNVVNNQLTLRSDTSSSTTFYGLIDEYSVGKVINVFYNSVVISGTESGTRSSWASLRTNSSTHTARNNLFLNLRTGGTGSHYAAGSEVTGGSYSVSNNVYAGTGTTPASFMDFSTTGSTVPVSFATWQSTTGETNSQAGPAGTGSFTAAIFSNAATGDLHLAPGGNPLVNTTGTPIAGVVDDYDGDPRNALTPSIGADEFVPPAIFGAWVATYGVASDSNALGANGLRNLLNFAFGIHPVTGGSGALQYAGTFAGDGTITATGLPRTWVETNVNGEDRRALFIRRKDFVAAGLTYTPQFSTDLTTWVNSSAGPLVLADDGTNQIVSVPFPIFIAGERTHFFRLSATLAP